MGTQIVTDPKGATVYNLQSRRLVPIEGLKLEVGSKIQVGEICLADPNYREYIPPFKQDTTDSYYVLCDVLEPVA